MPRNLTPKTVIDCGLIHNKGDRFPLLWLGCFDFRAPDFKPSLEYQFAKLSMIFEVKQDGRRKGRLVAGGHMVN
jgi:hypothetical protein